MKKAASTLLIIVLCIPATVIAGEGVLFFERGHYWIELTFRDGSGGRFIPENLSKANFTIMEQGVEKNSGFIPSRVEPDSSRMVVILSSGRLRGRRCYRVTCRDKLGGHIVFDRICDPFYYRPSGCAPRNFFSSYIAPAFSSSGRTYELSRLSAAYELSENRADTEIYINPRFEVGGWCFQPALEWDRVTYRSAGNSSGRRVAGLEGSYSRWFRELRYRLKVSYHHQLITESVVIPRYSHYLSTALEVRLDHFFDSANSFCYSVFKGVDLGFGYAWYHSSGSEEVWASSDFGNTVPFMEGRITWT
ncbi:MAG: hypothetical protein GF417_06215, partial [Candidatus Latescibacteria bacterium]|nr:hypothetical protein [bacterium]MBD3424013.1 hypothetical protein [Candidatus Latescibacterota bacterium]